MASLPPLPASLKPIQHYLKTATEHDQRDPVISYYCRFYAAQRAMEIDKQSSESKGFLLALMDLLEKSKQSMKENESMQNDVVAEAHVENYALKLFLYADNEDRAGRFGKNVIKSFYTAGMLMDVLTYFGDISEELEKNRKYAKWKAAYIHNCLKNNETPHPGPLEGEEGPADMSGGATAGGNVGFEQPGPSYQQPAAGYSQPAHQYPQGPGLGPAQPYTPNLPSPHHQPKAPATTPVEPPAATHVPQATPQRWEPAPNPSGVRLDAKDFEQAKKFCKYASSALNYEDTKTAIDNLTKALNLLTTGRA